MRQEVERSIKQAERDLENARKNIGIEVYEIYDRETAESKVEAAEALFRWMRELVQ